MEKIVIWTNRFITSILLLLGAYIILLPLTPEIVFALEKSNHKDLILDTNENSLLIPNILVNSKVNEGLDSTTLDKGLWRIPYTSTPDQGGNTVIVAHRFLYTTGPNTFYNLDKLKINDLIKLSWNGLVYEYKVFEVLEVDPVNIEIENNTEAPILTLYTCTPLWTSQKRLVVRANLIN